MTSLRAYASPRSYQDLPRQRQSTPDLCRICRNVPAFYFVLLLREDFTMSLIQSCKPRSSQSSTDGGSDRCDFMAGRGQISNSVQVPRLGWFDSDWYWADGEPTNWTLQIRGRSGQGDPGMSQFFVSLEDDKQKFGPSWVHDLYQDSPSGRCQQPILPAPASTGQSVRKSPRGCDSAALHADKP